MRPQATEAAGALSTAGLAALRQEYLDLLLTAGRLRGGEGGEPLDAAQLRRWAADRLRGCRERLGVRRLSAAPVVVAEAEKVIVSFLDSAAVVRFGAKAWRPLQADFYEDYKEGKEGRDAIADLGKYVYQRLERLRREREQLAGEPEELLEVYDRCLRLGYQASFEGRAEELEDLRGKIDAELRDRARRRRARDERAGAGVAAEDSDPALAPDLPPVPPAPARPLVLSLRIVISAAAILLIATLVGLQLGLVAKRRQTEQRLELVQKQLQEMTDRATASPY